jgi:hypothetical protein
MNCQAILTHLQESKINNFCIKLTAKIGCYVFELKSSKIIEMG